MELLKLKITGTAPLLMHSDKLANPLAPETRAHKELTAKRRKVEEDHLAIARSEFIAGTYWHADTNFYIPGSCVDACFLGGAKLSRLGTSWKRGALVLENRVKLLHDGPSTPDRLWESPEHVDVRGVKVGASKIMRHRAVFTAWAAELSLTINSQVLDLQEAKKAVEDAGALIGLLDFRPRFGRFHVEFA